MPHTSGLHRLIVPALVASCTFVGSSAEAGDFTYSEATNARIAAKFSIPVFYAIPAASRAPLSKSFDLTGELIDFKHPDGGGAKGDIGLRLIVIGRENLAENLGKSGLIQSGDILLTLRSEWGGGGAYANMQMGVSHAGLAYVKDGIAHNIDSPLNSEYNGADMRGMLNSEHYSTLRFIHVIRPRGLTEDEHNNIVAWASLLTEGARRIYPAQLAYNTDENDPNFKDGQPLVFVRDLARMALGQIPSSSLKMYSSEFVWAVLALRGCDPASTGEVFRGDRVPTCVNTVIEPMSATSFENGRAGLIDGPLLVIDAMGLPRDGREELIAAVFEQREGWVNRMSIGHRTVAVEMHETFGNFKAYYDGRSGSARQRLQARMMAEKAGYMLSKNYSATSFLINTLLPPDSQSRTMDYVATIMIE